MLTHDGEGGGPRFRSDDPERLDRWYAEHLGVRGSWSVRFRVDDLDATIARLRAEGIAVDVDTEWHADGRHAELRDPEGNPVQLWQPEGATTQEGLYVYAIEDDDEPGAATQPDTKRHRLPVWLPLILAAVVAGAFVFAFGPNTDDSSEASGNASETSQPTTRSTVTSTSTESNAVRVTELGHPMLGVTGGWEVFVQGAGTVARVELDTGTITYTKLTSTLADGPVSLIAGTSGVVVSSMGRGQAYYVADGEPPREVQFGTGGGTRLFPGPKPDQVWVGSLGLNRAPVRATSFTGRKTGQQISLPLHVSGVYRSDGRGNLLVSGPGGTYVASPDQLRRVTTGTVLASGPTRLLVLECDESAHCSSIVVNRSTGRRHVLDSGAQYGFGRNGVIAPDGSFAAVGTDRSRGPPGIRIVNLGGGQTYTPDTGVTRGFSGSAMAWAPNGEWLFVVTRQGDLVALNPTTRQKHTVNLDLPRIKNVAVRPATE